MCGGQAGQKSPNENGPLQQQLMTGDQKSKISIQHFELFRVAGQPFALQILLLSIPPTAGPRLRQEDGPASGLAAESSAHAKQEIICHFPTPAGSTVSAAEKQIKARSENTDCKRLQFSS